MNSLTKENYLKALFYLANEKNEIYIKDLSEHIGVKMPTVGSMMKKFSVEGWVIYESYKPIILTEIGRRKAALIVRKHRLTEMFLVENMKFGWEEVHNIAEELEHIQSTIFFDKIDELLNYPSTDPHGSPIPDKNGNVQKSNYHRLSDCLAGDIVESVRVIDSSEDFLKFLNDKKISIGTQIFIVKDEAFDGSKQLQYSGMNENFSKFVLEKILVKKF